MLTRCCGYGFGAANDLKSVSAAVAAAAARPLNGGGARAPSVPPLIRDWIKLSSLWSWRIAVALSLRQRHCVCVCTCVRVSHHTACNACTITTFTKYIKDTAALRMSSKSAAFFPFLPALYSQCMHVLIHSLWWSQVHLHSRCRRSWRKQQSQPLSIKPWSSTEPELPLNNTWLAFPIYTPPAGTQKRGCGFKHLSSSSNVSPSSRLPPDFLTQTQTWKYQEGEAVGGWCHLFQHMFVLVLKDSLIPESPFRDMEETKGREVGDGRLLLMGRLRWLKCVVWFDSLVFVWLLSNFDVEFTKSGFQCAKQGMICARIRILFQLK